MISTGIVSIKELESLQAIFDLINQNPKRHMAVDLKVTLRSILNEYFQPAWAR